jgi:hypothetical protein
VDPEEPAVESGWWRTVTDGFAAATLFLVVANFFTCVIGYGPALMVAQAGVLLAALGSVLSGAAAWALTRTARDAGRRAVMIGVPVFLLYGVLFAWLVLAVFSTSY